MQISAKIKKCMAFIIMLQILIMSNFNLLCANNKYTYSFDSSSGVGYMPDMTVIEGVGVTLPNNRYRKGRYKFSGWLDQYDNIYMNGQYIASPSESLTFKATWLYRDFNSQIKDRSREENRTDRFQGLSAYISNNRFDLRFIVNTLISDQDYIWQYNKDGIREGILLKKDSELGSALVGSKNGKQHYMLCLDTNYIKLKGYGLFKIEDRGSKYYVGFDGNGKLLSGFCRSTSLTKNVTLNNKLINSHRKVDIGSKTNEHINIVNGENAIYYLYALDNNCLGLSWNKTIEIDGIKYSFSEDGKMVSTKEQFAHEGKWEYDVINNTWKYYRIDMNGNVEYLVDGMYEIDSVGKLGRYIFDADGNMLIGLHQYNGQLFYMQEKGAHIGMVQT